MGIVKKIELLTKKIRPQLNTLNTMYIYKDIILKNLDYISSINKNKYVFPVLKGNAYGHGIEEISKILKNQKIEMIIVDSYYEALKVWSYKSVKILLMGYLLQENIKYINFNKLSIVVYDLNLINELGKINKKINIHIKIDTGMHRQGIYKEELQDFINNIKKYKNINIEGICTHLADADNELNDYSIKQLNNFKECINICKQNSLKIKYIHISNTAGSIKNFNIDEINSVRLGIGLYGINPLNKNDLLYEKGNGLSLGFEIKSTLVQKKFLKKGETVGYNCSFKAEKDMYIGIIPFGYYEGIPRIAGDYFFTYKNKKLKILGKICMNITIIDISEVNEINIGEKINIISNTGENNIYELAKKSKTIPYESLTNLSSTIRRIII